MNIKNMLLKMKIFLFNILLLLSSFGYANPACEQISEISETIMKSRQSGMPKNMMIATLKMTHTGVKPMDNFALDIVEYAFTHPKVENKEKAIKHFGAEMYDACEKMIAKHKAIKFLGG